MKKYFFLFLLFPIFLTSCFENVERLHYGVKYDACSAGLDSADLDIVYGKFNVCGPCCQVVDFPSTPYVKTFSQADTETSEPNSHFVVPFGPSSVEFDYNIEFQILTETDAKKVFLACKGGDKNFEGYINNNMKNELRNIFKNCMDRFKTPEQLIDSTSVFEAMAFKEMQNRFRKDGITIDRANLINKFRWPANVAKSLEDVLTIKAKTMKVESAARAAEIESESRLKTAKANAEADQLEATNAAKVKLIEADAEAERIRKINAALTPNYLKLKEIENYTYKTELVTPQGVYRISQKEE